ncbi:MAG: 2-oxoglutarate dehydrogenase E1 component, partial [Acidobacteriota bacterium]
MSSDSHIPSPLSSLTSPDYIDRLYGQWTADPLSVPEAWRQFFAGFELGADRVGAGPRADDAQSRVASLIFGYRSRGHMSADVNPLEDRPDPDEELAIEEFGFSAADLEQVFDTGHLGMAQRATLSEIIEFLKDTYCRSVGIEYIHIQDREIRRWLQAEMEPGRNRRQFEREDKARLLGHLLDADLFENFIHSRYQGQKRFSLEGAESLIPAMHQFMETAAATGADEVVIGMAHRGRLNVLVNILQKPYDMIFHEFEDNIQPHSESGGDVKYHRGYSSFYTTTDGTRLHLSLTANPSHLEAVNPVVEGRTRAKQRRRGDTDDRSLILPLLIHGDAAFAGQGLVAETLNLSQLKGYQVGGTVHIIVNNQIGFTTSPGDARSTLYPTDVAKMIEAPIFHVNGDDPEAVCYVVDLALRFRQRFHRDVIIDMLCYRKYGHNEGDEPAFTQPVMYQKIRNRPAVRKLYQLKLEGNRDLTLEQSAEIEQNLKDRLYDAFDAVKETCPVSLESEHAFGNLWQGLNGPYCFDCEPTTTDHETLLRVARALTTVPEGFNLNRKIERRLPAHLEAVQTKGEVDWGLAELLAYGTLLIEGLPVRLSGQDSIRGTFSHRHAGWFDTKDGEKYFPLNHISDDQAAFCAYNSMLSEAAVLGFDYGYALVEPNMLVLWEAQFGDFANGAQVIIDQFITVAMDKWERACGLVMLLPHGYEGQGPEHSNAYLERYLAACAEDNIQVCNLTTPAQFFHVLRRQLKRSFRRPLVIMAPKSLLRHKDVVSPVADLIDGHFLEILDDPTPPENPERLVLCSGKVYYDLANALNASGRDNIAIVRIEQLYPIPHAALSGILQSYAAADEVAWCQEEPQNQGAWYQTIHNLQASMREGQT